MHTIEYFHRVATVLASTRQSVVRRNDVIESKTNAKDIKQLEEARALTAKARDCSNPKEAIVFVRQAIFIFEEIFGPNHEDVAIRYVQLGELWECIGDTFIAERVYEHALSILDRCIFADEAGKQSLINRLSQLAFNHT